MRGYLLENGCLCEDDTKIPFSVAHFILNHIWFWRKAFERALNWVLLHFSIYFKKALKHRSSFTCSIIKDLCLSKLHNDFEYRCQNWRTLAISQFVPADNICAGGPAVPRPRPRPTSASAPGDTYPPASSSSWTGDLVEEEQHINHSLWRHRPIGELANCHCQAYKVVPMAMPMLWYSRNC